MFKKVFAVLLIFFAGFVLIACDETGGEVVVNVEGDVLVVRAWNTEFQDRFRDFYPGYVKTLSNGNDLLDDGTEVKWVIVSNDANAYQNALDAALSGQANASANDKVDIFLIEADYATKYANDKYAMDLVGELGIKESVFADQYDYTKTIVTDAEGKLRASSWQATPGLFAYRTDIAEEVLGTSDPVAIQALMSDWDKFDTLAGQMKTDGYKMLSGYDDAYRTFSNNFSNPWVDANDNVVVDQKVLDWIKQTKEYAEKGYNNGNELWSDGWSRDQGPDGDVFGFFYSTWGINFTLLGNSLADAEAPAELGNGLFGKYRVVAGPESYYWGGTWIVAAKGTDNPTLVKDVILKLTANEHIAEDITLEVEDYTNNKTAMNKLANDPLYGSAFLGGQNHIALFTEAAATIDMSNASPYDQGLNENIQTAMADYFNEEATFVEAWELFVNSITELYPELKFPASPLEP